MVIKIVCRMPISNILMKSTDELKSYCLASSKISQEWDWVSRDPGRLETWWGNSQVKFSLDKGQLTSSAFCQILSQLSGGGKAMKISRLKRDKGMECGRGLDWVAPPHSFGGESVETAHVIREQTPAHMGQEEFQEGPGLRSTKGSRALGALDRKGVTYESCLRQFSLRSTKISGTHLSSKETHSKPRPQEKLESAENGIDKSLESDRPGSHFWPCSELVD